MYNRNNRSIFWPVFILIFVVSMIIMLASEDKAHSAVSTTVKADTQLPCNPADAWTEIVIDTHTWQRYSWTGGPHASDDPPFFPGVDWQPNVAGDPHGIGHAGAYFRSHGNSGNGDWFYLQMVPGETHTVEHPAITCPPVDRTEHWVCIPGWTLPQLAVGPVQLQELLDQGGKISSQDVQDCWPTEVPTEEPTPTDQPTPDPGVTDDECAGTRHPLPVWCDHFDNPSKGGNTSSTSTEVPEIVHNYGPDGSTTLQGGKVVESVTYDDDIKEEGF